MELLQPPILEEHPSVSTWSCLAQIACGTPDYVLGTEDIGIAKNPCIHEYHHLVRYLLVTGDLSTNAQKPD